MKPQLEILSLLESGRSFNFFRMEVDRFPPYWHFHPELELTLITKGEGLRFVGNSILPFSDNDLVLVGENLPHHWVSSDVPTDAQEPQEAFVFQFRKEMFARFPEGQALMKLLQQAAAGIQFLTPDPALIDQFRTCEAQSPILQFATLIELLCALHQHSERQMLSTITYAPSVGRSTMGKGGASGAQRTLRSAAHSGRTYQSKVAQTTRYILEHLDQNLTVAHMAERTGLVGSSFCRWFKAATGNSFITFLNTARIEKAGQLLMQTDGTIAEIAFASGFESISHFNRVFKKVKGTTPTRFRNGG